MFNSLSGEAQVFYGDYISQAQTERVLTLQQEEFTRQKYRKKGHRVGQGSYVLSRGLERVHKAQTERVPGVRDGESSWDQRLREFHKAQTERVPGVRDVRVPGG